MATIGNLGKTIVFKVNSKKILTFSNLSRQVSGRWNEHGIVRKTPLLEFIGPAAGTLSFDIYLSADLGVKPRKTIERLEKLVNKGRHQPFVLGGKKIGNYDWVITDMSEAWDCIWSNGELIAARLSLNLKEYR